MALEFSPTVVDLSVVIDELLPCSWPGLPPYSARPTIGVDPPDPFVISRSLTLEEHLGTHADGPNHIALDDAGRRLEGTMDSVPLATLVGRPRIVDARSVRGSRDGESPWIREELVRGHEAATSPIVPGDVVLFWTGWADEYYRTSPAGQYYVEAPVAGRSPGWPVPHVDTLRYVAAAGVRVVGVDAPSLGAVHDALATHRVAALSGITPIENLANLGQVLDRQGLFIFLPLSVRNGTGAPGRAVILLDGGEANLPSSGLDPNHMEREQL